MHIIIFMLHAYDMYRPVCTLCTGRTEPLQSLNWIELNWKSRASDFSIFLSLSLSLSNSLFCLLALCHQLCLIHLYHVFVKSIHTHTHARTQYWVFDAAILSNKSYWNRRVSTLKKWFDSFKWLILPLSLSNSKRKCTHYSNKILWLRWNSCSSKNGKVNSNCIFASKTQLSSAGNRCGHDFDSSHRFIHTHTHTTDVRMCVQTYFPIEK